MILTNLYPRLISFASLQAAARRAQRGKRYRPAVLAFNADLEAELRGHRRNCARSPTNPTPTGSFASAIPSLG
jgi:hypothetical protein